MDTILSVTVCSLCPFACALCLIEGKEREAKNGKQWVTGRPIVSGSPKLKLAWLDTE